MADRQKEPATRRGFVDGMYHLTAPEYNTALRRAYLDGRKAQGEQPAPLDVERLRNWLRDQSRQAHEQANILPGDPDHAWDAGAAHMADATLTQLATLLESAGEQPAPLDVERLADAIHDTDCQYGDECRGRYWHLNGAQEIATEYTRLSDQPYTEPDQGGTE